MTVIWMLLKGIGIAVLVILGLFLAAVLAVLFVPVRYRADGSWREELTASAKLTWLLHLISVRIAYEKELSVQAFVCGIRVWPKAEKKIKRSRSAGQHTAPESAAEPATEPAAKPEAVQKAGSDDGQKKRVAAGNPDPKEQETPKIEEKPKSQGNPQPAEGRKRKRFSFDILKKRLIEALQKLRDSLQNIRGTAKRLYARFVSYKAIWDREETQRAFHLASSQLHKALRRVLPRRMNVRAVIGTDDPAFTGQILAVQGILYPWLGDKVQIVPDFEEKRFEGEFHLNGQFRTGVLGFYGLRLMLDRDVRRLIGILRGRTADKEDQNGRKQGQ